MMKRAFKFLSVLLVCLTAFLMSACTVTTYQTYQLSFYVAPITQENVIKEEHYDFNEMMSFIQEMKTDEAFIADIVNGVDEKIEDDGKGIYASLTERVCASLDIEFTNQTNVSADGTVKRTLITVQIVVVDDEAFRDALGDVIKVEAPKYIQANLPVPANCIGTHCELVSDYKGVNTQFGIGF